MSFKKYIITTVRGYCVCLRLRLGLLAAELRTDSRGLVFP